MSLAIPWDQVLRDPQPCAGGGGRGRPQPAPSGLAGPVPTACNPGACRAVGRGLQPKGVRVKETADFKVYTKGAGSGELKVTVKGPSKLGHGWDGQQQTPGLLLARPEALPCLGQRARSV